MKLKCLTQSQRDTRWGSALLGFNTGPSFTIYNYGCLITCLANYLGKQPDQVNDLLKNGPKWTIESGFTEGSGNFVWSKSSLVGLSQTYISPRYQDVAVSTQGITKMKELISQGYPLLAEVDFNPATNPEEMHFVLIAGIDDSGNLLVVDPWEGQWETWGEEAVKRNVYQFRAYDKFVETEDSIDIQVELDTCRLDRDTNHNDRMALYEELGFAGIFNRTIAVEKIRQLLELEKSFVQKDEQLKTANDNIRELEEKLKELQDEHLIFAVASTKTIEDQGREIQTLSTSLQELKEGVLTPVYRGWKDKLRDIIKIINMKVG